MATKKGSTGGSEKRELIEPRGDKRYIKRDEGGRIKESDDVGRSLSRDVRQSAKKKVKPGYGDQGDQPARKSAAKKSTASKSAGKKSAAGKSAAKKGAAKKSAAGKGASKNGASKKGASKKGAAKRG